MKLRWYQQDISRTLTDLLLLIVLTVTATLVYYRGLYGLMAAAAYFGGIAFLVAVYLTARRQWPRFMRYLATLVRQSY